MKVTRRTAARVVVGAPLALAAAPLAGLEPLFGIGAAAAQGETPAPTPTPAPVEDSDLGRFLAREEDGLSGEERRKVRRQLTNDVVPAGTFRALRARRSHDR